MTDRDSLRTLVLLCKDLETLGHGLDLEEVRKWLQRMVPAVHTQLAPDLGHQIRELARTVATGGAARLVLGLCSGEYPEGEVQAQMRKAGLDPLGLEVVNLGDHCARVHPRPEGTEKAKILLAAAVARARAFPGSRPENARPCLPSRMSRRALFTLPPLAYRAVPSIQRERCVVETGCRLCVQACPQKALNATDGQLSFEKARCQSCGLCLTACPREAIEFPGYAPAQLAAQITTLLDPAVGTLQPRGILFICRRRALVLERQARKVSQTSNAYGTPDMGLLPVQVPCLGMVPPTWLLACLTLGAAAVRVAPCLRGCPFGQEKVITGRVAYCQELLHLLGDPSRRIDFLHGADLKEQGSWGDPGTGGHRDTTLATSPRLPLSPAEVLLRLAEACGAKELVLAHPHSPSGVVEVADGCTGCGGCAAACPTGALALTHALPFRNGREVSLTFDAALCVACSQCLSRCPEAENKVLRLQRITDLQRLSRGRVTLYQDRDRRCEACGAPIATEAMLGRIKAVLGDEGATTFGVIARYCPSCRMGRQGPV